MVALRRTKSERAHMWQTAVLARTDYKLPSYRAFVGSRDQSPEEQAAAWRNAAAVLGLKMKSKKKKTKVVRFPARVRG